MKISKNNRRFSGPTRTSKENIRRVKINSLGGTKDSEEGKTGGSIAKVDALEELIGCAIL